MKGNSSERGRMVHICVVPGVSGGKVVSVTTHGSDEGVGWGRGGRLDKGHRCDSLTPALSCLPEYERTCELSMLTPTMTHDTELKWRKTSWHGPKRYPQGSVQLHLEYSTRCFGTNGLTRRELRHVPPSCPRPLSARLPDLCNNKRRSDHVW